MSPENKKAVEQLFKSCKEVMSYLSRTLKEGNVRDSKQLLSQAETCRDAIELKMTPIEARTSDDFGALVDAIVNASFKLDTLELNSTYKVGASRDALFGIRPNHSMDHAELDSDSLQSAPAA